MAGVVTDETQQFAAAVQGQATPAVTWSVDGGTGGNATVGTIDSQGLYTAPSQIGSYTVAANLSNLAENVKRHDRRIPPLIFPPALPWWLPQSSSCLPRSSQ